MLEKSKARQKNISGLTRVRDTQIVESLASLSRIEWALSRPDRACSKVKPKPRILLIMLFEWCCRRSVGDVPGFGGGSMEMHDGDGVQQSGK